MFCRQKNKNSTFYVNCESFVGTQILFIQRAEAEELVDEAEELVDEAVEASREAGEDTEVISEVISDSDSSHSQVRH